MLRVSQKPGSDWQIWLAFGMICTCYDELGDGGCYWHPLWSIPCIYKGFWNTFAAYVGNTCCGLPHVPCWECHKNQDLAGKFGWLLAWFAHDMMNLEMVDAIGTLCDPFDAYRKGFRTPLQPMWARLAVFYLIFHAESVTKTRIWLANLVGFWHGLCMMWWTWIWWMPLTPSVIHPMHIERYLEHLCSLCGQCLLCSTSFSMLRVSQNQGSDWQIWLAFGMV